MLKVLLSSSITTVVVFGGITLSPNTLSFSMRAQGESPYTQAVSITGTADTLSAHCTSGPNNNACTSLNWAFDATTAPTTMHVFFNGYNNSSYTPGTYTATLQVSSNMGCAGNCNISVTLVVVAGTPPVFKSISGSFTGCSNLDSVYVGDLESCITPGQRPGGSFDPPSRACGSYTDPNFGGTIKRVTATGDRTIAADSMQKGWNGNGTLIVTGTQKGAGYLTNVNTCSDDWTSIPASSASFDPSDDTGNTYYTLDGDSVTRRVLGTPPAITSTVVYKFSGPGTLSHLTNGGDGDVIKDGYWCFFTEGGTATQLILLNVRTGASVQFDYGPITFMSSPPRSCTLAKGFSPTNGKLYMVLGNYANVHGIGRSGANEILSWRIGDNTITDEGPQPLQPLAASDGYYSGPTVTNAACFAGECRYASHMDTVEANGHEFLVYPGGPSQTRRQVNPPYSSDYGYMLFMCLDCGPISNLEVDVESGGNAYYVGPLNASDEHISCARLAPVCLIESNNDPGLEAATITNIVNNGTGGVKITLSGTSPIVTGDPVLINANTGCTSANGRFPGGNVIALGNTITIAGVTCNSAFASGGSLTKDTTPAQYPHQQELMLLDATDIMTRQVIVTRLGKHRSVAFSHDAPNDTHYYGQSHPNINDLGTLGMFESTFGFPGVTDVYTIETGYSARASTSTYLLSMSAGPGGTVSPSSTSYGSGQTVQIIASPNPGYTFDGWVGSGTGSYTGNLAASSVTINGPVREVASFSPQCMYALSPGAQNIPAGGGSISESVTTGTGCLWSAASNSNWITVSPGPTGPGSGLVVFSVDANTAGGRSGSLTIAGQQITITQSGRDVNRPPTADSVTGSRPGSLSQSLTFKFSSENGYAYLSDASVLFNSGISKQNACLINYDTVTSGFYLLNDTGGEALGPLSSDGSLANSQCTLNSASTSGSGTTLTMALNVTFSDSFGSAQGIFMQALDSGGLNSGWQTKGTTAKFPTTPPTTDSVSGVTPGTSHQSLTLKYSSVNGYSYLGSVHVAFNSSLTGGNTCWIYYDRPSNGFFLYNDGGTAVLGPLTQAISLTNSQCTLNSAQASGSGNTLTVNVDVTFSQSFGPAHTIIMYAVDANGLNSGWQTKGTTTANPPALTIIKNHSGNFVQGQTAAQYTLWVENTVGSGPTNGLVTVTEIPPVGLTITAMAGANWNCNILPVCTRSDSLHAGHVYEPIFVRVSVGTGTPSTLTNRATVSGGGSVSATATDPTTINGAPVLSITEVHNGTFMQGQQNATYTLTVSNAASVSTTSGTVTVTETVPSSFTLVSMSGPNWLCQANTCTRSDVLPPGQSYPAITVLVNVSNSASTPQVNSVSVSGGGAMNASVTDSILIMKRPGTSPFPVHRKVGVYRNGSWYVDRNGSNQWEDSASYPAYNFGVAGDIPVQGDWDGSGALRIGVYRNGSWYVDWNGNHQWDGATVDRVFQFGVPGDIPVVGDWDGTGKLRIGVYRNGFWYVDLNGNNQWDGVGRDAIFSFGVPGDLPVVADWDNGQLKLGVYRRGLWYIDLNGDFQWDGATDRIFPFGEPGDIPVAGPWY